MGHGRRFGDWESSAPSRLLHPELPEAWLRVARVVLLARHLLTQELAGGEDVAVDRPQEVPLRGLGPQVEIDVQGVEPEVVAVGRLYGAAAVARLETELQRPGTGP